MKAHFALKPDVETCRSDGNVEPSKEGLGHAELIEKVLLPLRGTKLNCSLPFIFKPRVKGKGLAKSATDKGMLELKPVSSISLVGKPGVRS